MGALTFLPLSPAKQKEEIKCECRVTKIAGGIKRDMRDRKGEAFMVHST